MVYKPEGNCTDCGNFDKHRSHKGRCGECGIERVRKNNEEMHRKKGKAWRKYKQSMKSWAENL